MTILELSDIIGIIFFALSGYIIGVRASLDILGVLISSFLTALGGGIIRDVIIGSIPYFFDSYLPALLVFCVFLLSFALKLHRFDLENRNFFIFFDSVGLVSFSISGSLIAVSNELNFAGTLLLSFTTAVGGGIMRDVLINQVPLILSVGFYGTVSLLIGCAIFILGLFDFLNYYTITVIFAVGVTLRLFAYRYKWQLPKIS